MDIFDRFVAPYVAPAPAVTPPPHEPPELRAFDRTLQTIPPPVFGLAPLTVADARACVDQALAAYLDEKEPDYMLLVRAAPGVGKTYRAVRAAEKLARRGKRVLYAGPRHAFYADVLNLSEEPDWWYEWLPRQAGDPDKGKPETCIHVDAIEGWLAKGYDAMPFCAGVCGWDYVNKGCAWHAQKKLSHRIIYGQHAHVLAHPLPFDAVIGDENPIGAFVNEWQIGHKWLMPSGIDPTAALTHLLHAMTSLAVTTKKPLSGPELLRLLGGPQYVLDACEEFTATPDSLPLAPQIHRPGDAEQADYWHLPTLVSLLRKEAAAAVAGRKYLERIILANEKLLLLRRKPPAEKLPPHVVWLDATAEPHLYETVFGRPAQVIDAAPQLQGRIFQVWERANGKGSLTKSGPQEQLVTQVKHIAAKYTAPAVITFQGLVEQIEKLGLPAMHYYAARGSNAFENCDALIVTGAPMPEAKALHKLARMVFAERSEPFDDRWTTDVRAYTYVGPDGQGRAYPVGGYWHDKDLGALLWSVREAEIIQAVHRARPTLREVDIWLLTNIPIPELPPYDLLDLRALFGVPASAQGVNVFKWGPDFAAVVAALMAEKGFVSAADLAERLNIHRDTAKKYLAQLAETGEWVLTKVAQGGRPGAALRRLS